MIVVSAHSMQRRADVANSPVDSAVASYSAIFQVWIWSIEHPYHEPARSPLPAFSSAKARPTCGRTTALGLSCTMATVTKARAATGTS